MWRRFARRVVSAAEDDQPALFAWSLLAALVLFAVLAGPFFVGHVYVRDDLGAFHLPARAFYAEQLAHDEPFDWMPQLFCGFYFTGEGQAGTYHPLHLLLYRWLPLRAAVCWEWLASYPLMLAGMYLFLRRLLARRDAAMLGGLLLTFCGFNLLHFVHPNAVAIVAHIPWLLWAIDIALVESARPKAALAQAGIALLTGSQLLLGYPQYVWFSLLAEAGYALFVLGRQRAASRDGSAHLAPPPENPGYRQSPLARLLIAKGCGLLLGAVQLLPTLDALLHSARQSADAAFSCWGSLEPLNLVQLVAPYLFTARVLGQNTHELGLYAGAVPLVLVAWLLSRRRDLGTLRPLVWATGLFGLLALVLALGEYGPLYRLQSCLPLVGSFRFPCRYIVLFQLAVAVLAATGFAQLARECQSKRSRMFSRRVHAALPGLNACAPAAPFVLSCALALVGLFLQGRPDIAPVPAVLAGPLLLGMATLLVVLAGRGKRAALVGLIVLAAADLGCYGLTYSVYPYHARLDQFASAAVAPPAQPDGRVVASLVRFDQPGLRTGNQMTLAGWSRADGYAGLEPERRLDYRRLSALRVAGVHWVKRDATTAAIEGLTAHDSHWLTVPRPLPRVRLVTRVIPSNDPARDLEAVSLESTALADLPIALPPSTPGNARLIAERPGRLGIGVDCPSRQLLVVAESYHPDWQATVDGLAQPVLRVNGDFMGCVVGPGRQQVVLQFRPRSLARGSVASWLGLALISLFVVGGGWGITALCPSHPSSHWIRRG